MSEVPGFKKTLDEMFEIHKKKNNDYAGKEDPFANFRMASKMGICDDETAILIRLTDKFSRLITLKNSKSGPKVMDEKFEDTLIDAANYLIIWKCLREQNKK